MLLDYSGGETFNVSFMEKKGTRDSGFVRHESEAASTLFAYLYFALSPK